MARRYSDLGSTWSRSPIWGDREADRSAVRSVWKAPRPSPRRSDISRVPYPLAHFLVDLRIEPKHDIGKVRLDSGATLA